MYRVPPIILALLAAGCTMTPRDTTGPAQHARAEARIADALEGFSAGPPQRCIDRTRVIRIQKYTDTILYEYTPREIYRVTTTPGCFGLARNETVVAQTPTTQLCSGDIIFTTDSTARTPTGSCSLGDFIPYRRPAS